MEPTIPGFQCLKRCIQYMSSHPNKPILFPSNSYDISKNFIITLTFTRVEDHTTKNFLELHQDVYYD